MHKPIHRFTDFMSWLIKQYREILEYTARQYPFRIINGHRSLRTGETIFTIQFVGKSTCIKVSAEELAEDDDLIQGFSPQDVKRIMKASLIKTKLSIIPGGQQQPPPYKIIAKNFERQQSKPSYVVEQITDNKKITKTIALEEVAQCNEILLKFSKQDIFEIAYTAGMNSVLNAQDQMRHTEENTL